MSNENLSISFISPSDQNSHQFLFKIFLLRETFEMKEENQRIDHVKKSKKPRKSKRSKKHVETADEKIHYEEMRDFSSEQPSDMQQVHEVTDLKTCADLVDKFRSHCEEYSVLGFRLQSVYVSRKKRKTLLQLSSHRGQWAVFDLTVLKMIPDNLKALLEDANVLKVGVDASAIAVMLSKSYNVTVSRIFDIRYLIQTKLMSELQNFSANHVIALFKQSEEEERESSSTTDTQQQAVHKFIEEKCQPYIDKIYRENVIKYSKPQTALQKPVVHVISDTEKCLDITEKIQKHCQETKVLGLSCQYSKQYSKETVFLLQLATYHGLCVFIQLRCIKQIPHELQDILNDKKILKVGINISKAVTRLEGDYDIRVVSTLDLRYLANECRIMSGDVDLDRQSEVFLNVNIYAEDWRSQIIDWKSKSISEIEIEYAVNYVHVTIELFKVLEKKLVEEKFSGDSKKFINEFCMSHLNESYPKQNLQGVSRVTNQDWLTLPKPDICLVSTVEECKDVVKRLQRHCDEYNVVGFDCEWLPKGQCKVALLQLATHRGLCALIRLCKLEIVPDELNEFLDDPFILKVGIEACTDAKKLGKEYHLDVSSVLDLKILAKKCQIQESGLGRLSERVLHVKLDHKISGRLAQKFHKKWENNTLDEEHIKYAANDVLVCIELFKKFQDKLMEENRSGDRAQDVQQFLEEYCEEHVEDN